MHPGPRRPQRPPPRSFQPTSPTRSCRRLPQTIAPRSGGRLAGRLGGRQVCARSSGSRSRVVIQDHSSLLSTLQPEEAEEARQLCYSAVETCLDVYGDVDQNTLVALNNLSALLCACGDLSAALEHCLKACRVGRTLHGEQHRDTMLALDCLAQILARQGRTSDFMPQMLALGLSYATALARAERVGALPGGRCASKSNCFMAELHSEELMGLDEMQPLSRTPSSSYRELARILPSRSDSSRSQGSQDGEEPVRIFGGRRNKAVYVPAPVHTVALAQHGAPMSSHTPSPRMLERAGSSLFDRPFPLLSSPSAGVHPAIQRHPTALAATACVKEPQPQAFAAACASCRENIFVAPLISRASSSSIESIDWDVQHGRPRIAVEPHNGGPSAEGRRLPENTQDCTPVFTNIAKCVCARRSLGAPTGGASSKRISWCLQEGNYVEEIAHHRRSGRSYDADETLDMDALRKGPKANSKATTTNQSNIDSTSSCDNTGKLVLPPPPPATRTHESVISMGPWEVIKCAMKAHHGASLHYRALWDLV